MHDRLHDDEITIGEGVVRSLLALGLPESAGDELAPVRSSGTDNVLWRIRRPGSTDLVVRLPRMESAARSLTTELPVLDQLAGRALPVSIPVVRHRGQPTEHYPFPWAVLEWLDGVDGWTDRRQAAANGEAMAQSLATFVTTIGALEGVVAPDRRPGQRGGPLVAILERLDRWLDDPALAADDLLDGAAVRRVAAAARELAQTATEVAPVLVHGDLLPGNLLLREGRLAAVIDWGSAAYADPAQDLGPAWAVLDARSRRVFRQAVDADDATWLRAMAFELEHAVGAILYYRPRRHPLADIMARTLERLLADADSGAI